MYCILCNLYISFLWCLYANHPHPIIICAYVCYRLITVCLKVLNRTCSLALQLLSLAVVYPHYSINLAALRLR